LPGAELAAFHEDSSASIDRLGSLNSPVGSAEVAWLLLLATVQFEGKAFLREIGCRLSARGEVGGIESGVRGPGRKVLFLGEHVHREGTSAVRSAVTCSRTLRRHRAAADRRADVVTRAQANAISACDVARR